ncbi:zinc finger and BTB domain-containing protein 38 [Plectropomus leopardus]|uniref:zinc finger and BTB domain-containing protein 38 n=1 Tax=Plectropomus leopardus TaxID=160734 RepID=UPI001C4C124C|nr:zinc finger and BTB domain-containing protein 38 [Plectropomus leopardus]XP_042342557.1 zinc finger and BTB domain-containing protein 38 [Plectropomus leopardus]XP_042342558.1 zinc finger and BTB domain-containing protein 38 [Plectropomus leopardus]XP_042342559.1 zinc finger and BTB domain-containing protein 38 [Plectropomus leopardus]XP_042342560.1 zinc finger and BTB domain-containing protein 38 [Plectropomus leopardus]XP_042342561.1 zinc finger and BTB domain-containing protein 38 [Plect
MTVVSPCTQNLMDSAHPQTVLSKLNEQRSQGLFCDVTIVVEDVKFRAHKNILAACSGYFRNTLTTPETWSSGQVVELMDLKSEVFASILNFIYCSKVTSASAEDTGGLVAAGKKLGIPFLEKLAEQERQDKCVKPTDSSTTPVSKKTKKEAQRPEDLDRGPRITNAFSITEVCPGNNLLTHLVQTNGERQSPDVGQLPSSCPTTSCLSGNNETTHALSEHSYAVSKSTEGKDSSQWDNKKVCKPAIPHPKQLIYRNTGPLKKRHRLRGTLCRSILPAPAEPQADKPNTVTPTLADGVSAAPAVSMTPPPLFSEAETQKRTDPELPVAADSGLMELGPPTLSPHPEDSISIYGCDHCPEIFANKALLTIHSEVHKKRFVSHLFCKFCHRKFIHLKRMRNHEQVCPKAVRGPPKLHAPDISTKDVEQITDDKPNTESMVTQLPTPKISSPYTPEPLQADQSEPPQEEKVVKLGSSQRRYNCSVCKRVYVTLSSLKRHENVHSWQRAYPCHYCNKVFALAEYRTKHEIWHTGERRYQCIFCLETFMTYYILKNHQKSFHGIDPSLAVKKKSANGGLKASVYPIKLYRLLPMKFRKRQYKTYSQTYSESVERGDEAPPDNNSLIPPFEENGLISHPDTVSFPLTFMATTKMVAPVIPHISFGKPCDQHVEQSLNSDLEIQKGTRKEAENRDSPFSDYNSTFSLQSESPALGYKDDPPVLSNSEHIGRNVPFFNSLNTVKKLGELSASAKRVEDMTKEILQSSTENLVRDKDVRAKTETYIAKPACPGPSVDGAAMPLCQITVKIGNEAIIRRRIKGSKLFPRKKRRIRDRSEESPSRCPPTREDSESPRLRLRPEATAATEPETYDDPNDCDTADMLWRPYYSYKAKKKRKKLRLKHRKALFHGYPDISADRTAAGEAHFDKSSWLTEESMSGGSGEVKRSLSKNSSPRATYNCDICDSSFITETGLRAHVIGSHPCFCRTCGKQGPPGEAPAGGDYICNSCMENGSCFDNTPRSPNPEKKYRCSFCPQRFLYLATKRSHEKKHQETNEEGYNSDNFSPCSKYSAHLCEDNKQDTIKTEESDNQGATDIKSERVEEGHFSIDKMKPKIEDTSDFMSLAAYQDVSYPNIKSPLSPCIDPLFSLTHSKLKHKTAKKRINAQHPMHLISKKQTCDRDSDSNKDTLMGPRTTGHNDREKSCKLLRRNDSETKGAHISIHKPEKWVCKEEPFF